MLVAFAVAVLVAAPWHIYQFVVHRDWFIAEYVRFQLLGSGITAPSRYTGDTNFWFYLRTLLRTDPILLVVVVDEPSLDRHRVETLESGTGSLAGELGSSLRRSVSRIFGTRAAYYLMPLLPVLVLMSVEFSPLLRGRLAWIACAVLIVAFGVKVWAGDAAWGLDYGPKTVPSASALDKYAASAPNQRVADRVAGR